MTVWFVILVSGAYLLGSLPLSYIVAKLSKGIDLREYGTGQVGGGNLWRMTSWKLAVPVGLFDVAKGAVMVLVAESVGMNATQQLIVGVAAIIGHNWPIFLRFHGGRGIGTAAGVVIILAIIGSITPWLTITFIATIIAGMLILRSSPLPVLIAVATLPVTSWWLHEPLSVTMGFLAMLLIVVIKRLTAQRSAEMASTRRRWLFLYRLLFDRDIPDRKTWMYRKPAETDVTE